MYKKITHTIVEEHFDHPIASQIKKTIDRSRIPTTEIFSESKFRADVHNYFLTLQSYLTEMTDSVNKPEQYLIAAFENMFKDNWIDGLGNMTKPFYFSDFSEVMNVTMRQLAIVTSSMVQNVQSGKETRNLVDIFRNQEASLIAEAMGSVNYSWRYAEIRKMFVDIVINILAETSKKWNKDTVNEQIAKDNLAGLFSMFERIFVEGIITQFPNRFTSSTAPSTMSNNRDVM